MHTHKCLWEEEVMHAYKTHYTHTCLTSGSLFTSILVPPSTPSSFGNNFLLRLAEELVVSKLKRTHS